MKSQGIIGIHPLATANNHNLVRSNGDVRVRTTIMEQLIDKKEISIVFCFYSLQHIQIKETKLIQSLKSFKSVLQFDEAAFSVCDILQTISQYLVKYLVFLFLFQ